MADFETPRLRRFRETLAGMIPCEPEQVRTDLYGMEPQELLERYLNWADRFVAPRPRRIVKSKGFFRSVRPHARAGRE